MSQIRPFLGAPLDKDNRYFWNASAPENRGLEKLAPSALPDESGSPTLQTILENFDHFDLRLRHSTLRLLTHKYVKLRKRLDEIETNQTDKYPKFVREWEKQLTELGGKAEGKAKFGKDEVWDVVKDNYPEYFTEQKAMQELRTLRSSMEEVVGLTGPVATVVARIERLADLYGAKIEGLPLDEPRAPRRAAAKGTSAAANSIDHGDYAILVEWLDGRMQSLQDAIGEALSCLEGREKELQSVAEIIAAFSTEWTYATDNYLNFVIVGPAGSGKTTFAKHMGRILGYSGLLFNGNVMKETTRSDFIGQFLGQSGPKTIAQLESSRESVLFIDEAYSLAKCEKLRQWANEDLRRANDFGSERCAEWDSYSSEALAAMVAWLSQNMGQIIVIAAGYQKDMMQTFLIINEGIPRRMQPIIKLDPLSDDKMLDIFYASCRQKGVGKPDDTVGQVPEAQACQKDTFPPVSRKISQPAEACLREFLLADKPRVMEVLQTTPPQPIIQRPVMRYEASDMVMLAATVLTYMTSRTNRAPESKAETRRGGGKKAAAPVVVEIGIKLLNRCAMERILDKITMDRLQLHIPPSGDCSK